MKLVACSLTYTVLSCPDLSPEIQPSVFISIFPWFLLLLQSAVATGRQSVDHWLNVSLHSGLTGFCRPPFAVMSMLFGRRESVYTNVSYLSSGADLYALWYSCLTVWI